MPRSMAFAFALAASAASMMCSPRVCLSAAIDMPAIPDSLGVNIHFTDAKPGEMEMIRAAGFHVLRMDLVWASVEKTPGIYDFAHYDRLVAAAEANGLRLLFILDYNNSFYDDNLSPHSAAGRAAFAKFAAAAAKRYAGKNILWEIWNEPNIAQFWKPLPNVENYAALALATAKAIHEVAPGETIIAPATSTIDLPFLEACFMAGLLEHLGGVSVHPYRPTNPETVVDEYRKLRQLIVRYAPEGKQIPIFSGEWGYTSADPLVSPDTQARYLARQWLTNLSCGIPVSIWYDWHDDGPDPKEREHRFGTVEHPLLHGAEESYKPKPAYLAARTLTNQLAGHRYNKRLALGDARDHLLLFQGDDDITLVAWTTSPEPRRVTLPLSGGTFNVVSCLGDTLPSLKAETTGLSLELTESPLYLRATEPDPWLALIASWQPLTDVDAAIAPLSHPIIGTFRNTLSEPVTVARLAGDITVAPGATQTIRGEWYITRVPRTWIFSQLDIVGRPRLRQLATLTVANPLNIQVLPPMSGKTPIAVENVGSQPLTADIQLAPGHSQPLSLAAGEHKIVVFDLELLLVKPYITVKGEAIAVALPQRLGPISLPVLNAHPDGDPAIASEISLSPVPAKPGLPVPDAQVMQLDYTFAEGWKFARIASPEPTPIEGAPLRMGIWVHGDNSGNHARIRFVDSTGQTFQPGGFPLDFTGWRYLEFPMTAQPAHWGGVNDGIIHYPIRLDTVLLIDSAGRKATKGSVQFTHATLIFPVNEP